MTAIQIENLSANYGPVKALRDVSLHVEDGEIFGLLGPNGAGKTTLLACIEALHRPASGSVHVGGLDVSRDPSGVKRKLGIQLQRTALLDELTVAELVEVYAALYEVFPTAEETNQLLQRFNLQELRSKPARRLSGGQQQRLALALSVANNPEIVLLDEPTTALDPNARRALWDIMRQLHDDGRTLVITTHSMEEAEALCGRVAIIDNGQVIACDTPAKLVANSGLSSVLKATVELPLDQVKPLAGVQSARYTGQYIEIETTQPQATMEALHSLAARLGRTMSDIAMRQPNLEDVFIKLTGRSLVTTSGD
jgi:ABC-2 type transport system ATP-binding protein